MLETVGIILLVLVGIVLLGWICTVVFALIVGNKIRKRVNAEFDNEPFFRDTNPARTRVRNWRDK